MKKVPTTASYRLTPEQCQAVVDRQARILYRYCRKNNLHYLVTGSSGGRDSAITLAVAQRACLLAAGDGYKLVSVGVVLPCKSKAKFTRLGILAIRAFGARLMGTDLSLTYDAYMAGNVEGSRNKFPALDRQVQNLLEEEQDQAGLKRLAWSKKLSRGNIMARLRMTALYLIAGELGSAMVLSTDNLSEYWMGFWTINGDVGDYGMIQNVLKGLELEDVARYLGVPKAILAEAPDDGLGITSQGDAGQLGADYSTVDRVMVSLLQQGFRPNGSRKQLRHLPAVPGVDPQLVLSLATRCLNAAYKRKGTINLTREELGLLPISSLKLD